MQALISGTNEPNVYQLSNFRDSSPLENLALGEIQISVSSAFAPYTDVDAQSAHPQMDQYTNFADNIINFDTENFDFSCLAPYPGSMLLDHQSSDMVTPENRAMNTERLSASLDNLLFLNQQAQLQNATNSASSINGLDLDTMVPLSFPLPTPPPTVSSLANTPPKPSYSTIQSPNYGTQHNYTQIYPTGGSNVMLATPHPSPPRPGPPHHRYTMPLPPTSTSSSTPYVPPSGAANASRRRAAATWQSSFAVTLDRTDEDVPPPVEPRGRQTPAWTVPAGAN